MSSELETLKIENEQLKRERDEWQQQAATSAQAITMFQTERDRLKAENEGLRYAFNQSLDEEGTLRAEVERLKSENKGIRHTLCKDIEFAEKELTAAREELLVSKQSYQAELTNSANLLAQLADERARSARLRETLREITWCGRDSHRLGCPSECPSVIAHEALASETEGK